jgi:hypothetical protein
MVSVGVQRRELEAGNLRSKGERIHLDGVEDVLSSELRRKKVGQVLDHHVAADLPRVAPLLEVHGLRKMQLHFAGTAWEDQRPPKSGNHIRNLRERVVGIGRALLDIVRQLRAQMAHQSVGKSAGQRGHGSFRVHVFTAIFADRVLRYRAGWVEVDIVLAVVARSVDPG